MGTFLSNFYIKKKMNIKQLTEELAKILESENVKIGEFTLIPHGENTVKYYDKSVEYFKTHLKRGM